MAYNFERFEKNKSRQETRISLTKKYNIGFPTAFYAQNKIEKYDLAVLFYDSQKQAIAIYLTNDATEKGTFKISHDKKGMGATLSVTSFLRTNNIDPKIYAGKYEWKPEIIPEVGKVYVIELKTKA